MFLYFFYASNETKTKQIRQVLMEIYTGSQESADSHISIKTWPICFNSVSLDAQEKNESESMKVHIERAVRGDGGEGGGMINREVHMQ